MHSSLDQVNEQATAIEEMRSILGSTQADLAKHERDNSSLRQQLKQRESALSEEKARTQSLRQDISRLDGDAAQMRSRVAELELQVCTTANQRCNLDLCLSSCNCGP